MNIGQKMDMKKRSLYILSLYVMLILAIFIIPASLFPEGGRVKYAYLHTKNSVYIESKYTFEIRIIFGMLFKYFGMDMSVSMRIFPFVCVSMYILSLVCIFYGWYAFLTFGMPFGMRFLPLVCVFYVWYAYFTICSCYLPFEGIF